jgi:hypothetical protein
MSNHGPYSDFGLFGAQVPLQLFADSETAFARIPSGAPLVPVGSRGPALCRIVSLSDWLQTNVHRNEK